LFLKNLSKEEQLNTLSHAIGVVIGWIALPILLIKNQEKEFIQVLSICIYVFCYVLLFSASTVYHAISNPKKKHQARKLDHISIFFLIAGTYTPVCLITLIESSGFQLFSIIWSIAFAGLFLKIFFTGKLEILSILLYLSMGWFVIFEIKNLYLLLNSQSFNFLILGGIFYTIGTIFYSFKKIKYSHFIWHLFVLAGSISHLMMVYYIV
jgi:hemolysin III